MSESTNTVQAEEPSNATAPVTTDDNATMTGNDTTSTDDTTKSQNATITDVTITDAATDAAADAATEGDKAVASETEVKSQDAVIPEGETKSDDVKETAKPANNGKFNTYNRKKDLKKFDASLVPVDPENMASQIRTQVEFYFGDSNLPGDNFLWTQTGGAENRPVPLKTICTFGRMRNFKPHEAVVAALKESQKLVVSGDEGSESVSRREPYDPEAAKSQHDLESRSLYAKGFGEEKPSTQFDVEAFFVRFERVEAVRLRRNHTGEFKGSVFVEFQSPDQVAAFLALDPKPEWQGRALEFRSKRDYVDEKNKLIKEGKLQPSGERGAFWGPYDNRGRGRGGHGRGGRGGRGGGRGGDRGRGGRGGRGRDNRNGGDDWKARKYSDNRGGRRDRNEETAAKKDKDAGSGAKSTKRDREDEAVAEGQPPAKKADNKMESDAKVDAPAKTEAPVEAPASSKAEE